MKTLDGEARSKLEAEVGALVRTSREHAGLNQKSLAELSGVSAATISRLERAVKHAEHGTLRRIFPWIAPMLDAKMTRQSFMQKVAALGIVLPIPTDGYLPLHPFKVTPHAIRIDLKSMRKDIFSGRADVVAARCQDAIKILPLSDWIKSRDGIELMSRLHKELALALNEANPLERYGENIDAAIEAQDWAFELTCADERLRDQLWLGASMVRGIAGRILETEIESDPNAHPRLKRLYRKALDDFPDQHPLEDATETGLLEDRIWARTDIMKLYGRSREADHHKLVDQQFEKARRELEDAERTLHDFRRDFDTNGLDGSYIVSPSALEMLPFLTFEAYARALAERGATGDALDHIAEAEKLASLATNIFQGRYTKANALLRDPSRRGEGEALVYELVKDTPSPYQHHKAVKLAQRFDVPLH